MPLAGSDPTGRVDAHIKWAARYSRQNRSKKATAHIERALKYRFGTGGPAATTIQISPPPPNELVRTGRMARLLVRISPLHGTTGHLAKASCVFMDRLEQPELEVSIEMKIVSVKDLDAGKLIGLLGWDTKSYDWTSSARAAIGRSQLIREIRGESFNIAIVSTLTVTKHGQEPDAQTEGIGLRVLHSILTHEEFLAATDIGDSSLLFMGNDPYSAELNGRIALTETGGPLNLYDKLDQVNLFGLVSFTHPSTPYTPESVRSALIRDLGTFGMPIPAVFLDAVRTANSAIKVKRKLTSAPAPMVVLSGGLYPQSSSGGCFFVSATIRLSTRTSSVVLKADDLPFWFTEQGVASKPTGVAQVIPQVWADIARRISRARATIGGKEWEEMYSNIEGPLVELAHA